MAASITLKCGWLTIPPRTFRASGETEKSDAPDSAVSMRRFLPRRRARQRTMKLKRRRSLAS